VIPIVIVSQTIQVLQNGFFVIFVFDLHLRIGSIDSVQVRFSNPLISVTFWVWQEVDFDSLLIIIGLNFDYDA
jgi:hypothetical protein